MTAPELGSTPPMPHDRTIEFMAELRALLNRYSRENISDTPDFILASYMLSCLTSFDTATRHRDEWHGNTRKQREATT